MHFICGTEGSLTLPRLDLWRLSERARVGSADLAESVAVAKGNPYAEQMRHFASVIRREEEPITSGFDATRTLEATLAVKKAAESGETVRLS